MRIHIKPFWEIFKNWSVFFVYTMKVYEVQCCFGAHWLSLYGQKVLIYLKYLLLCSRFGTTSFTHQSKTCTMLLQPFRSLFLSFVEHKEKDILKNISVFFVYTMIVSEILCCFGPQWPSLYGQKLFFFFVPGLEQHNLLTIPKSFQVSFFCGTQKVIFWKTY